MRRSGNRRLHGRPRLLSSLAILPVALVFGCLALPARATNLLALVNTGEIYSSTNQGTSWTIVATLPVHDAVGVVAGAISAQLYLVTTSGGFYSSSNAGTSWSGVGNVPASDVTGLLLLPDLTLRLLTTTGSIYTSTNQGVSFSGLATLNASNFVSLARAPVSQNLYALTRSGEVYQRTNAGSTWTGQGTFNASDAVGLQGVGSSLFALTSAGDVYQSNDGAASWQGIGTLSQVGVIALTHDGGTLLAGLSTGEVARSTDGISWSWQGTVNQVTMRSLGVDTPVSSSVGPETRNPSLALDAPWPNPARRGESVNLQLRLTTYADVILELYNASGRKVAERPSQTFPAGTTRLQWTPRVKAGSVFFLEMRTASGQTAGRRIAMVP